jgi:hypothetical protein
MESRRFISFAIFASIISQFHVHCLCPETVKKNSSVELSLKSFNVLAFNETNRALVLDVDLYQDLPSSVLQEKSPSDLVEETKIWLGSYCGDFAAYPEYSGYVSTKERTEFVWKLKESLCSGKKAKDGETHFSLQIEDPKEVSRGTELVWKKEEPVLMGSHILNQKTHHAFEAEDGRLMLVSLIETGTCQRPQHPGISCLITSSCLRMDFSVRECTMKDEEKCGLKKT